MLKKLYDFDFKSAISEKGSFEGLLSPYFPYVDNFGDSVMPNAYQKTIAQKGSKRVLLWQHKQDTSIGEVTLREGSDGLYVQGQLDLTLIDAQETWKRIKGGLAKGLSIGYLPVRDAIEGGIRKLYEIALHEASIVTFPAAEIAQITSFKADGTSDPGLVRFSNQIDQFRKDLKVWKAPQF